jgi:hypothetical protein
MQEQQKRIFYARLERERALHRHARNARERAAQGLEWVGFPDPLMRLFMPQFKLMAARGFDSIQHTRNHVHLRIDEVVKVLQRQADMAPHALAHIDLTKPVQRAALAAFLAPIYARYDSTCARPEWSTLRAYPASTSCGIAGSCCTGTSWRTASPLRRWTCSSAGTPTTPDYPW